MIVIIEGANLVGKSTLTKVLASHNLPIYEGLESLPSQTIKKHNLSDVIDSDLYALDFIRQTGHNVVLERCILSGMIYQEIPEQYVEEYFQLLPEDSHLFLLTCSSEILKQRATISRLTDRKLTIEEVQEAKEKYIKALCTLTHLPKTTIVDTGKDGWLPKVENEILEIFREKK